MSPGSAAFNTHTFLQYDGIDHADGEMKVGAQTHPVVLRVENPAGESNQVELLRRRRPAALKSVQASSGQSNTA